MRTRFWISIAAVAAIAVGSVIAAIGVYENDKGDFERVQRDDAARAAHQAEAVAALSIGKLSTAAAIVQTQGQVGRHEFRVIGRTLLEKGALDGAGYVPRVPAAQRAAFERAVGFEIRERAAGPFLKRAGARPVYYPVTFGTSEVEQPQRVRGFDLGSDPLRARVLQRAGETGMAVATPVLRLLIGGSGINVFRPIYEDGASVKTPTQRQQALKGFIAGSFRVHDVAAAASGVLPNDATMQVIVNDRRAFGPAGDLDDPARVPIHIADRTWLLVLQDPGSPPVGLPIAIGILGISLAALFASLIVSWSRGERMRELERQASQDALTGLGNRRRFEEDLAAAMARSRRDGSTGALLMLDLDRFKLVNDSHGHPAGDQAIKAVAETLRKRTRASDSLARLGGDEFAVILPRCSSQEALIAAEAIAEEIRHQHGEDGHASLTVSIGVATFGEDPKASVATVVSDADAAMYAAKDDGRDAIRVFEPAVREDASSR
jgi:diguanylate cyclase (GGDEF)-like protein